ncbi:Arrestin (or S-antigen), N-terminal domain, partial [Teratosphaeria destructans]
MPHPPSRPSNAGNVLAMPLKLRKLVASQRIIIRINLASRKRTWTTHDRIEGTVAITPPTDTRFDEIDIEFVGTSRTYIERLTTAAAVSGRSQAFHQFLKLQQPGLSARYPEDGVLRAAQTYELPFVFVIPPQLLPRVCRHKVASEAVREAHLCLPPTLGDKDAAHAKDTLDDMAPDMASVRYGIFCSISRVKAHDGDEPSRVTLASKARKLRVIPATSELPPLDVGGVGSDYVLHREKNVRKGMLKGKLGVLTMEAAQPQPLHMRLSDPDSRPSTMATVMLRFDPSEPCSPPPRLSTLSSKLKVCTFFASSARHAFPCKETSVLDMSQGCHTESLPLSSRCVANVEWTACDPAKPHTIERRDSACSTTTSTSLHAGEVPAPSPAYKGTTYYSARLLIPLSLPTHKAFVPTFHSCLSQPRLPAQAR